MAAHSVTSNQTPTHHRAGRPRFVSQAACWVFRRCGWRISGTIPCDRKLILVVGPHTSNWDFFVAVLAMLALDIRLHFLAKHTLFVKPLGFVMRRLGGIPIDRSRAGGFVEETSEFMRRSDTLILAITPEGTRGKVGRLKTGFSRIAGSVPCPILPVLLDFREREVRLLAPQSAQAPESDASEIWQIFTQVTPKIPQNF